MPLVNAMIKHYKRKLNLREDKITCSMLFQIISFPFHQIKHCIHREVLIDDGTPLSEDKACHGEQSVQKIGDGLGAKRLMMHYEGDLEHDGSLLKNSEAILFRTVHVPISI
ncbi:hypothetical protein T4C_2293 [Trichinella pseudospiralis]|uniref:Uncharacterized protein n=1 Tax=Trichinella pseudospiralis TaxID=6337 RepID=A0A0V1JIC8_TRIPS|nr:hypothetical protein T4C_2293 [Trichinella pseudospiralis]